MDEAQKITVTIADVARAAGVATSTVSRALTKPGRISEPLRRKIEMVAKEMGYSPNVHARSLSSGRTQTIALLIPEVTNPYFFDLIRGTQAEAKRHGYRHLLFDTEMSPRLEAEFIDELVGVVDGIVLTGSRQTDVDVLTASRKIPLVVVNREIEGVQSVVVDTTEAIVRALEYLASLGHRKMAFLSGLTVSWSSERRWKAIEEAAPALGVTCTRIGPFTDMNSGSAAADAVIHQGVTAGLFFNDMLAIGALKRFAERGIVVPRDVSVVGCDDIFGADFCNPPLTTLTAPVAEVGRTATDMLIARLRGQPIVRPRLKLEARLTVRQSTGPVCLDPPPA